MQLEPRPGGKPALDLRMLVGGVVVQDEVDLQGLGDLNAMLDA
jgi:hypothetical protein